MQHTALQLYVGLLLIAAGVVLAAWNAVRSSRARAHENHVVAPRVRAWSAHELGLLHRLGARLIVSRYMVSDAEFEAAERLMARASGMESRSRTTIAVRLEVLRPLLQLEELVERMESLSARMRRWRPGRARGQG